MSVAAHEENTKETNVGALKLSGELNACSLIAKSTSALTAVQAEIADIPKKVIDTTFHAPKPIISDKTESELSGASNNESMKTKRPQHGKLPLRSNCQSPAKQATTIARECASSCGTSKFGRRAQRHI